MNNPRRRLYNGTTVQAALSIEKEGLRPGTYLTPSKADAIRYALARAQFEGLEPAVVVVSKPPSGLDADPMERGCYVNYKHIPSEYILGWEAIKYEQSISNLTSTK